MRYLVVTLLLAGCAPQMQATSAGGVVSTYGNINNPKSLAMAQKHCEESGKVAKANDVSLWGGTMTFECVAP